MITESSCATPRTEQADVTENTKETNVCTQQRQVVSNVLCSPTEFCLYSSLVFYVTYFIRFHNLPVM